MSNQLGGHKMYLIKTLPARLLDFSPHSIHSLSGSFRSDAMPVPGLTSIRLHKSAEQKCLLSSITWSQRWLIPPDPFLQPLLWICWLLNHFPSPPFLFRFPLNRVSRAECNTLRFHIWLKGNMEINWLRLLAAFYTRLYSVRGAVQLPFHCDSPPATCLLACTQPGYQRWMSPFSPYCPRGRAAGRAVLMRAGTAPVWLKIGQI